MQYTALILALSAVGVLAAEKRQLNIPTDSVGLSVLSVLQTAIPTSEQVFALASPSAFASEVASEIAAGTPPAWYTGLPSDVKSYLPILYPVATAAASSAVTTSAPVSSSAAGTASAGSTGLVGGNSTVITSVSSATLKTSGTGAGQASSTKGSATSAAGSTGAAAASYPTGVVGAGVAGAIGLIGMLAL